MLEDILEKGFAGLGLSIDNWSPLSTRPVQA